MKRNIVFIILFLVAAFWFVFALLSGSEEYGGGVSGIIQNSPNAIPWLMLLVLVLVAYKKPFIGGLIITIFGIISIFFFRTYVDIVVFFMVSVPLIVLGVILMLPKISTKK